MLRLNVNSPDDKSKKGGKGKKKQSKEKAKTSALHLPVDGGSDVDAKQRHEGSSEYRTAR